MCDNASTGRKENNDSEKGEQNGIRQCSEVSRGGYHSPDRSIDEAEAMAGAIRRRAFNLFQSVIA